MESEQIPNPNSRITLSTKLDKLGCRIARLNWELLDEDFSTIRRSQALIDDALKSKGIGRVSKWLGDETPPTTIGIGNHNMGATRMSESPKFGVVDANCRVHGLNNLFIAGSSVFPTAGAANPTLTIVALSIRLADHIKSLSH